MSPSKVVFESIMVILAVTAAWLLYSVLLEYPNSQILSTANGRTTKSALWQGMDMMQIPFGSYYYYYCQIPNQRGGEEQLEELLEKTGNKNGGMAYVNKFVRDGNYTNASNGDVSKSKALLSEVPMDHTQIDDYVDTNADGDKDSDNLSHDNRYTTGWQ